MALFGRGKKAKAQEAALAETRSAASDGAAIANVDANMKAHPVREDQKLSAKVANSIEICRTWPNAATPNPWVSRVFAALEKEHAKVACDGEIKIYSEGPNAWPLIAKCASCQFKMQVMQGSIAPMPESSASPPF